MPGWDLSPTSILMSALLSPSRCLISLLVSIVPLSGLASEVHVAEKSTPSPAAATSAATAPAPGNAALGSAGGLQQEVDDLKKQVQQLEGQLSTLNLEWKLALGFLNPAGLPEGLQVLQSAVKERPDLLVGVDRVELIRAFDAASPPMKTTGGESVAREGSYAPEVLYSGDPNAIMLWGPYVKLEKGRYLVTYRFRFEGEPQPAPIDTAFLDVAHKAVTNSARKPPAADTPTAAWVEWAVPVSVPDPREFEFRFWPNGRLAAVDRIYIFRLYNGPEKCYSVMGASQTTGTWPLKDGMQVKEALEGIRGPHDRGNPGICLLYRQVKGITVTETLDLTADGGTKVLERDDILVIPEK